MSDKNDLDQMGSLVPERLARHWFDVANDLRAENERLNKQIESIMTTADIIDQRYQRLMKAGDNLVFVASEHPAANPFVNAWFAAKEGSLP